MRIFFVLLLLSSCINVHVHRLAKTWDAKEYKNNSQSQFMSAQNALKRIHFDPKYHVLDVGCGDGKITSSIADAVKDGKVIGIDTAPAMIDFAKKQFTEKKNLSFKQMNVENIAWRQKFDVVVSFSAMQWVLQQGQALKGIFNALKKDGQFLLSMPRGYPSALAKALEDVMKDEKWEQFFKDFELGQKFYSSQQYTALLKDVGFSKTLVHEVAAFDQFENQTAFSNFVRQWLPHLSRIPAEKKDEFMQDLMARYLNYLPPQSDGSVWFQKYTLEAWAFKSS